MEPYVDSMSIYELVHIFDQGKKLSSEWAWRSSLECTALLIFGEKVILPPAPPGSRTGHGADFEYGRLLKGLGRAVRPNVKPSRSTSASALNRALQWIDENENQISVRLDDLFLAGGENHQHFEPWIESAIRIGWPEHIQRLGGLYDRELVPSITRIISRSAFIEGEVSDDLLHELRHRTQDIGELRGIMRSAHSEFMVLQYAYAAAAFARGPYHEMVASRRKGAKIVHHPMRRLILPPGNDAETVILSNGAEFLARIALGGAALERNSERRLTRYVENIGMIREYLARNEVQRNSLTEVCLYEDDAREMSVEVARCAGLAVHPWWLDKAIYITSTGTGGLLPVFLFMPFPLYVQAVGSVGITALAGLTVPSTYRHMSRRFRSFESIGGETGGRISPDWIRTARRDLP